MCRYMRVQDHPTCEHVCARPAHVQAHVHRTSPCADMHVQEQPMCRHTHVQEQPL